jgi:hypothetical protein
MGRDTVASRASRPQEARGGVGCYPASSAGVAGFWGARSAVYRQPAQTHEQPAASQTHVGRPWHPIGATGCTPHVPPLAPLRAAPPLCRPAATAIPACLPLARPLAPQPRIITRSHAPPAQRAHRRRILAMVGTGGRLARGSA